MKKWTNLFTFLWNFALGHNLGAFSFYTAHDTISLPLTWLHFYWYSV